jgi:spermidine synthase
MNETALRAARPSLLELPNPFAGEAGCIRLLEHPNCDRPRLVARLLAGTYDKPFVVEEDDSRLLHFSKRYVQSAMRLSDPHALEFAYTRKMMSFLLFVHQPKRVLMLGLGGGSLAKYCHRHLPWTRTTVIEIDSRVLAFREQFLVPPDDARLRVLVGDGADFLRLCQADQDVVMMDAYDRDGLSASVSTTGFYLNVRDALTRRGMLVANMVGAKTEYAAHLEMIADAFRGNIIVLPIESDDNCVVFAFRDASFEPRWRWIETQARAMHKRYGLDFPMFAARLKQRRKNGYMQQILRQPEEW